MRRPISSASIISSPILAVCLTCHAVDENRRLSFDDATELLTGPPGLSRRRIGRPEDAATGPIDRLKGDAGPQRLCGHQLTHDMTSPGGVSALVLALIFRSHRCFVKETGEEIISACLLASGRGDDKASPRGIGALAA